MPDADHDGLGFSKVKPFFSALGRFFARLFAAVGRGEDATVAFLARHWFAGLVILFSVSVLALWKVPQWQTSPALTTPARFEAEDHARATLAQILGGLFLLAGAYFAWKRLEVAREGQITERFTRAIDQLGAVDEKGNPKLEIRLGGIYALERIARDSERDHWPIMEILTAYIRKHAPLQEGEDGKLDYVNAEPVTEDIQAILTVIGRRIRTYGNGEDRPLDLRETNLGGANLNEANLHGADLIRANLRNVKFNKANLQGANLERAHLQCGIFQAANLQRANLDSTKWSFADLTKADLQGAWLVGADLQGARLNRANLRGAILYTAELRGAYLGAANLQGAHLEDAKLQGALGLTQAQVDSAFGTEKTQLPPNRQRPESWKEATAT
jgi:hypothetical protein